MSIRVSEGEGREKRIIYIYEIMAENFPNLKKEKDIQVQEAQKVPNRINPKRPTARHTIIKMAELRILKAAREKQFKKKIIKLSADFPAGQKKVA